MTTAAVVPSNNGGQPGGPEPLQKRRTMELSGKGFIALYAVVLAALVLGWFLGSPLGLLPVALAIALPPLMGSRFYKRGRIGDDGRPGTSYFAGRGYASAAMSGVMWMMGAVFSLLLAITPAAGFAALLMGFLLSLTLFLGFWLPSFRSTSEVFLGDDGVAIFQGGFLRWNSSWGDITKIWLSPGGKYSGSSVTFEASDKSRGGVDDLQDLSWSTFCALVRAVRMEVWLRPHITVEDKLSQIADVAAREVSEKANESH